MLEAELSTSPVVTRLLVGAACALPEACVESLPRAGGRSRARVLCIAIPDDRGDESFADDLNMGRGIVSGRVALLLRSTEIRPHRPNDLLPLTRRESRVVCTQALHPSPNTWPEDKSAAEPNTWAWGRGATWGAHRDLQSVGSGTLHHGGAASLARGGAARPWARARTWNQLAAGRSTMKARPRLGVGARRDL